MAQDPPIPTEAYSSWFSELWSDSSFMPHGHCYLWDPLVLWSHVASDALICLAYYSIPLILFAFVRKRRDVPFNAIFIIFGVFIMACGTTHLLDVVTVWDPMYRLSALVKIITAIVSVIAVMMLIPIMPKALALPSLQAANDQLSKTTNDLRRSNAELEQFAYIASHDLQEPLRMVSVYVDLLKERHQKNLEPQAVDYLSRAAAGAERMHLLIGSLLAFARIDQQPVSVARTDATSALVDALSNLTPNISESAAIITHGDLGEVRMDKTQLTLVFQNLISNAIKFRKPDAGPPTIHISAERKHDQMIIAVRDNGIGIDAAYFERIFLVFQRIHNPGKYEGSGIGLASVRKVVERHGGRVWVESTPQVGSVFRFSIPDVPTPAGLPV